MSTSIQQINSCPDYIKLFINTNYSDLKNIYNENSKEDEIGILYMICSQKENKMDLQYADDSYMTTMITSESLLNLKSNIPDDKILLFINDIDLTSIFLIHI